VRELIRAAEVQTGVRPRRRVELVVERIEHQQALMARWQRLAEQQQAKCDRLKVTRERLIGQLYQAEHTPKALISRQKQARWREQVAGWRKRLPKVTQELAKAEQLPIQHQASAQLHATRLAELRAWQAQLEADNQANPNAPDHVEARTDAGFTSGEHLAWLLEMGYWPNTKAPNGRTATALMTGLPSPE